MNRNPNENEIKYIRDSLYRFNEEIVGSDGHAPINIVEYDSEGNIIGGIVGLCLCVIIGIFVVPAIKLDSPGPALFSQTRIGKNGRKFKLYKFRSMYIDAEERKKELMGQNEMNGLMFKMEDDPRVTKVGKFLRKTSLDEFPQFFNVIKGDMSLVGIRPPT